MSGKKNRKKRLLLLLAVIIGAALFFVWTEVSDAKEDALAKGEPQEMSITGTVMRMDITDEIFTDGFLEMESESVYMETDGIVEEVLAREGEHVTEGQTLLRLSTDSIEERIEDALTALSDASVSYEAAKRNLDVAKALYEQGALTKNEYLARQESLTKSYNSYVSKKKELDRLREDYENLEVKAVASGLLLEISPSVSDKVAEDAQIAVIAVSEKMTIRVDIEEYDVPSVALGTHATVTVPALDKAYAGTVVSLSPIAKTTGTVAMVEAEIVLNEADSALIPGYSADVSIKHVDLPDVVVVPYTAIKTIGGRDVVFWVQEDDTLKMQDVVTGYEDVIFTQIMDEELVGKRIVRTALATMKDEMTLEEAERLLAESTEEGAPDGLPMMPESGGGMGGGQRPQRNLND